MTRPTLLFLIVLTATAACSAARSGPEAAAAESVPGPAAEPAAESGGLPSEQAGYYTEAQARRGGELFVDVCSECHSRSDFRGRDFEWNWRRQTVRNLFRELTRTMPEDDPGSLGDQQYVDVIAYILQINDYPAGRVELIPTDSVMDLVPLGPNARRSP